MSQNVARPRGSGKKSGHALTLPAATILLAILGGLGTVFSNGGNQSWVSQRAEFSPVDFLESRSGVAFRTEFAPVLFMKKISATEYLCVDEGSVYYAYLTSHQELTGITVDSSCIPLDFTDRPGDSLHPALITAPIGKSYLYYAFLPGLEPVSDTAVLVEAHGDVFVLVNLDTLRHLGIDVEARS